MSSMIRVKNKSKYIKKKKPSYYNKFNRKANFAFIRRPLIAADRQDVRLKWAETVEFTSITDAHAIFFSGNGLWDPRAGVINDQPTGFDQWMALYGRYRVLGSKIVVRFMNQSNDPISVIVWPQIQSALPSTKPDVWKTQSYCQVKGVGPISGSTNCEIRSYMSSRNLYGYEEIGQNYLFSGSASANPANMWYWVVGLHKINANSLESVFCEVTIEYYCQFYDKLVLAES